MDNIIMFLYFIVLIIFISKIILLTLVSSSNFLDLSIVLIQQILFFYRYNHHFPIIIHKVNLIPPLIRYL